VWGVECGMFLLVDSPIYSLDISFVVRFETATACDSYIVHLIV